MPPPPDKPGESGNSSEDRSDSPSAGASSAGAAPSGKPSVSVGASLGGGLSSSSPNGPSGAPPTITRPGAARPDAGPRPAATGPVAAAPVSGAAGSASAVGAARVTEAVRTARTAVSGGARGPRRARLNVKRIDPWSVFKFSFAVSLVLFIVVIVATAVLYLALDAMGVFEKVNTSLGDLISASGGSEGSTFKITAKGVIGTSALIGVVNVVLFTALATLGAFIYNVCADLVGGVELTLAERD
ncbi:hypothetical protein GCM10009687_15290 [Asanoa iriomotensis]